MTVKRDPARVRLEPATIVVTTDCCEKDMVLPREPIDLAEPRRLLCLWCGRRWQLQLSEDPALGNAGGLVGPARDAAAAAMAAGPMVTDRNRLVARCGWTPQVSRHSLPGDLLRLVVGRWHGVAQQPEGGR